VNLEGVSGPLGATLPAVPCSVSKGPLSPAPDGQYCSLTPGLAAGKSHHSSENRRRLGSLQTCFLVRLHRGRPEPRLSTFERCWLGGATGRRRAAPSRERDVVVAGGRWHGLTVQRVRERLQRGRTAMTARLLPNSPGAFLYGRGTRGGRRRCLGGPLAQEFGQGGVPCNKRCIGWTTIP